MSKAKLKKTLTAVLLIFLIAAAMVYLPKLLNHGTDPTPDTTAAFSVEEKTTAEPATPAPETTPETTSSFVRPTFDFTEEETLPPQTDPPQTKQEQGPTLPPQTDPPETDPPQTKQEQGPTLPPQTDPPETTAAPQTGPSGITVREDGEYNDKEHVALYIHLYGKLPSNYITKKKAESLGWSGGSLEKYAPGKSIGGSRFGNNEGRLPKGHTYYECDIDTKGKKSRGAKRIVYSTDGMVFYTDDHYETFERLY